MKITIIKKAQLTKDADRAACPFIVEAAGGPGRK